MMKKFAKRVIPAAMAFTLAAAPILTYADEFVPGPGQKYDDATMARLKDNVLEYDEIELLIEEYNQTLKNLKENYYDTKDDYKNVAKLKEQIFEGSGSLAEQANDMAGMADMFKDALGYQSMLTPGSYGDMLYASEVLQQKAEQMTLSADSLTAVTPDMLRLKMVDSVRDSLIAGAQSAMIGYEQLLLQKDSLTDTVGLLKEVYQSTQKQASLGLTTDIAVITARQNLESVEADMITLEANEIKIRQSLCNLMGWAYNAQPEIRKMPAADLTRIDKMNPEIDKEAAIGSNYTLRYNKLSYEELTPGSVEQENMARTIEEQTAVISSSLVNLYNEVLQKRNEYQTAIAAFDLEKTRMEAAERKIAVGTIGRLEYLQQKNAYNTKEIAVRTAELNLFQAMETYDWAVKGNLNLS